MTMGPYYRGSSDSVGLYGSSSSFGGTYFEWFIFQESATQPTTPTGGSWSFSTNTGTPPTGWTSSPPVNPTNLIWISIALVNSKNSNSLTWTIPGVMSTSIYGPTGPTGPTGSAGSAGPTGPTGPTVYPDAGIAVSTGTAWTTSKTAPSGDVVGTTDTQTLSNKQFSTNVGIGVTPSAWGSNYRVLEVSNGPFGTFVGGSNGTFYAGTNNYFDGFDYLYKVTGNATQYIQQTNGRHTWYTSSSGTANNVITFVQAMQLNENNNLAVAGQIAGAYLSNGTNTAAQQLGSYTVVKNTISSSTTLTTTVAAAGSRATVLIVSSGTTSRTVTFGTGFLSTGTLSTGTTSGRTFAISFVSDGTTMIETGRTTGM